MSGRLDGRVAIVTGSGRGLGRSHALELARRGAYVIVNDIGVDVHGQATPLSPAGSVVAEIEAAGGSAIVSRHDVSDWEQAGDLIGLAMATCGRLDILVNNAGILRDRLLANMSEREWDDVVRVHLKGHAAPIRHAVALWRNEAKSGRPVAASIIHTTSASGFVGAFGQANYSAAKIAVIGLSNVLVAEYARYGVRSNVISPIATTRMSDHSALAYGQGDAVGEDHRSLLMPERVSEIVAWLCEEACTVTRQVIHVCGDRCLIMRVPAIHAEISLGQASGWTPEVLAQKLRGDELAPPMGFEELFPQSLHAYDEKGPPVAT